VTETGVSLLDIGNEGATLTLGGVTYKVRPLGLGDLVKTKAFIRQTRLQAILELPIDNDVRAKALSNTVCEPIMDGMIWLDIESLTYCIWLSLRDTNPSKYTLEYVHRMPRTDRDVLEEVIRYISGFKKPEPAADPTTPTPGA